MNMLPIAPQIKIWFECLFVFILLSYAIRSEVKQRKHLTASVSAALCVPLLVDVLVYHAIRPAAVWVALNTPFTIATAVFIYARILKKGVRKVVKYCVSLFLLLAGR